MSIKFYCSCGKRLKAKDQMAARRTVCPACGNPVGIPSTKPTQRGTAAAPMTPMDRQARQREELGAVATLADKPPASGSPRVPERSVALSGEFNPEHLPEPETEVLLKPPPGKSRVRWFRPLQNRFHQGRLLVGAIPLVLGLALVFTAASGLAMLLWPKIAELPIYVSLAFGLMPLLLVGIACGFFQSILRSALSGDCRASQNVLKNTTIFVACFVPGPAVLTLVAIYFWLEGGDSTLGDQILLAELVVVAIAHFVVSFLAVAISGRVRDANPLRAVQLVHQLGWRSRFVVLAGAILCAVNALLVMNALGDLEARSGWLTLFGWWASFMLVFTVLCRWLGQLAANQISPSVLAAKAATPAQRDRE